MPPSDKGIQNIDRLIHEPSRLTIMMHLYVVESADFQFLQHQTRALTAQKHHYFFHIFGILFLYALGICIEKKEALAE